MKAKTIWIIVGIIILILIVANWNKIFGQEKVPSTMFRAGGSTKCTKCGDPCGVGGVCIGSGDNCDNVQCYENQYNKTQKCPHGLYWNPISKQCRPLGRG